MNISKNIIDPILKLPLVDVDAMANKGYRVVVDAVYSDRRYSRAHAAQGPGRNGKRIALRADGPLPHNPEPLPEHLTDIIREIKKESTIWALW